MLKDTSDTYRTEKIIERALHCKLIEQINPFLPLAKGYGLEGQFAR